MDYFLYNEYRISLRRFVTPRINFLLPSSSAISANLAKSLASSLLFTHMPAIYHIFILYVYTISVYLCALLRLA